MSFMNQRIKTRLTFTASELIETKQSFVLQLNANDVREVTKITLDISKCLATNIQIIYCSRFVASALSNALTMTLLVKLAALRLCRHTSFNTYTHRASI